MSRFNAVRRFVASKRDNYVIRSVARGCRIYLDLYDNARHWSFETNGEKHVSQAVLSRTDGPVLDVGAHYGEYSRLLAELDPQRPIFAFEPIPAHAAVAAKRLETFPNVKLIRKGLSDVSGIEIVYLSSRHPQTASTIPYTHDFDSGGARVDVPCEFTSGDMFCVETGISEVSFLKIDVEGMESRVLKGFNDMLGRGVIHVIQFEHGPTHAVTGHTISVLKRMMGYYGYKTWIVFPNGLRSIEEIGIDHESFRGRNLLSIHEKHEIRYRDLVIS